MNKKRALGLSLLVYPVYILHLLIMVLKSEYGLWSSVIEAGMTEFFIQAYGLWYVGFVLRLILHTIAAIRSIIASVDYKEYHFNLITFFIAITAFMIDHIIWAVRFGSVILPFFPFVYYTACFILFVVIAQKQGEGNVYTPMISEAHKCMKRCIKCFLKFMENKIL